MKQSRSQSHEAHHVLGTCLRYPSTHRQDDLQVGASGEASFPIRSVSLHHIAARLQYPPPHDPECTNVYPENDFINGSLRLMTLSADNPL